MAENQITQDEIERAKALESILVLDSELKARQNQIDIIDQIERLNSRLPINLHDKKPATADDLKELLGRLAEFDLKSKPATKAELKEIFAKLMAHY